MNYRIEKDTMGKVEVPADKYWGAQTQRSVGYFPIGPAASMPTETAQLLPRFCGIAISRASGTRAATAAVPSEEPSSTTSTSSIAGWPMTERSTASIRGASL